MLSSSFTLEDLEGGETSSPRDPVTSLNVASGRSSLPRFSFLGLVLGLRRALCHHVDPSQREEKGFADVAMASLSRFSLFHVPVASVKC